MTESNNESKKITENKKMIEDTEKEMWDKVKKEEDEDERQDLETIAIHAHQTPGKTFVTMVELWMSGRFLHLQIGTNRHIWDMADPKNNPSLRKEKKD